MKYSVFKGGRQRAKTTEMSNKTCIPFFVLANHVVAVSEIDLLTDAQHQANDRPKATDYRLGILKTECFWKY